MTLYLTIAALIVACAVWWKLWVAALKCPSVVTPEESPDQVSEGHPPA